MPGVQKRCADWNCIGKGEQDTPVVTACRQTKAAAGTITVHAKHESAIENWFIGVYLNEFSELCAAKQLNCCYCWKKMLKLDEQLKAAVLRLPVKEKDKLLLRLVAKDKSLVKRLYFELMEGGETRDERAAELRRQIADNLAEGLKQPLSPGYLLMYLRYWSGQITDHVKTTKDKLGEVALNAFLLAETFRLFRPMLDAHSARRSDTLAPYVVRKLIGLQGKASKLHEDYHIEFRSDMKFIFEQVWTFPPSAVYAKEWGLPRYWDL